MLIVHHLNNSRSQRILWLLEELGVPYEIRQHARDAVTNLAPPSLLDVHPLGKSPLIEDDGRVIAESGAIVEYICERHGGAALVPARDSDSWAEHLELMHFAEGSVMLPVLLHLYVGRLGEAGAPLHPRVESQLDLVFDHMERVLRPSGHYVLDTLSAVDIMLSFPAEVAIAQGRAATRPKLAAFVEMIQARPAYRRAIDKGGAYQFAR
ncbi:glutathione S-transferase family protein [Sphingoaurantiacus capsulatus]|uniref:Glutathione S-transferase family protein n=1 Tax=Sphingoaurantiacus capsulatus TaxID=1771310 RepID=A0ABV7XDF5_9SPHN